MSCALRAATVVCCRIAPPLRRDNNVRPVLDLGTALPYASSTYDVTHNSAKSLLTYSLKNIESDDNRARERFGMPQSL